MLSPSLARTALVTAGSVGRRVGRQRAAVGVVAARFMSEESGSNDRLHSTDIAFKPAESGWGGGSKYSSNFDRIFGNKENDKTQSTGQGESSKSA